MSGAYNLCVGIIFFNGNNSVIDKVKEFSEYIDDVVVIDNNSTNCDSIIKELKKITNTTVICNKRNYGIAYALNQALDFSSQRGKRYLLTMDQDSDISREDVEELIKGIASHNKVLSVGPFYNSKGIIEEKETRLVDYLITSGNLVDVDAIKSIGGYDNGLFIDCVDIDFSWNIRANGYKLLKVGNTGMRHKIGEYEFSKLFNIRYQSHSAFRYYYMYRNNIIMYRRYKRLFPKQCLKLFLSLMLSMIKLLVLESSKKDKLSNAFKGVKDGFKYEIERKQ